MCNFNYFISGYFACGGIEEANDMNSNQGCKIRCSPFKCIQSFFQIYEVLTYSFAAPRKPCKPPKTDHQERHSKEKEQEELKELNTMTKYFQNYFNSFLSFKKSLPCLLGMHYVQLTENCLCYNFRVLLSESGFLCF